MVMIIIASILTKEAEDIVGANKSYSNRRSRENKYSCDTPTIVGKIYV